MSYFNQVQLTDSAGNIIGVAGATQSLRTIAMVHDLAVVHNMVENHQKREIIGYNGNVSTSLEDIAELPTVSIPLPVSATTMTIVSTSVNDTIVGTGARTVEIHGLNNDGNEISDLINLDGTTPVGLTNSYWRINSVHGMSVGSLGAADGNITVQGSVVATVYNQITAGGNMSLQGQFTVPAGHWAYITGWSAGLTTTDNNTTGRAILRATADWSDRSYLPGVFHFQDIITSQDGTVPSKKFLRFPALCDIKVSAQKLEGTGTLYGSCNISLTYELL